eukprot:8045485-Pyramimonas_sp.AAC.1
MCILGGHLAGLVGTQPVAHLGGECLGVPVLRREVPSLRSRMAPQGEGAGGSPLHLFGLAPPTLP